MEIVSGNGSRKIGNQEHIAECFAVSGDPFMPTPGGTTAVVESALNWASIGERNKRAIRMTIRAIFMAKASLTILGGGMLTDPECAVSASVFPAMVRYGLSSDSDVRLGGDADWDTLDAGLAEMQRALDDFDRAFEDMLENKKDR